MPDRSQYPTFSPEEMAQRHARVRTLMAEAEVEALLVYGTGRFAAEIYWLTQWPAGVEAYVLFQQGQEPVVLGQFYNLVPQARRMSVIEDVRWAGSNTGDGAAKLLAERGLHRANVGLVGPIPHQQHSKLRERLPKARLTDLTGNFRMMRAVKSEAEIERLRIASRLTDDSMQALADGLRPGIREEELPALLEPVYLKAGGYAGIHFMASMPMRSPDVQVPAQYQSTRQLQNGDCLITEITGSYWGYGGQIHRTYSLGEGPTPEWRKLHDAAVEAFEAILDVLKDGASTRQVEEAGEVIHSRGYNVCDDLLHGSGLYPPIIQTHTARRHEGGEVIFRENMVVVIQPNPITPDERMGLQFGETVVIRRNGYERLNHFPREWIVV